MAFLVRRFFSTTVRARTMVKHTHVTPAPLTEQVLLEGAELQQLAQKSKGHWKEMSKEEIIQLYRGTFPMTFKEMRRNTTTAGDYVKVVPGVLIGIAFAAWLASFLRRTIGPELPHTFENKEWEAATREKLLKQKANPISGISSRARN